MRVLRTVVEARAVLADLPRPLGLTPTMGALHEGHLALVREARRRCAGVAASVFVNPTQFGPGEDFARYPRDERRDLALLEEAGVDFVFTPAPDDMYEPGYSTIVHVAGPLTESLEGASRTSHFDGVATIVTKLLTIVAPDVAFFGQKDAQQLAVIRRLVADLDLPVEIAAVETVREPDGLALSSRNSYLDEEQRAAAPGLYRALLAGREVAAANGGPDDVVAAVRAALGGGPSLPARAAAAQFAIDYVVVVDPATFKPETTVGPQSLIVAAARLGGTRLIDNLPALAPAGVAAAAAAAPAAATPAAATPAAAATGRARPEQTRPEQTRPERAHARQEHARSMNKMSHRSATGRLPGANRTARRPQPGAPSKEG